MYERYRYCTRTISTKFSIYLQLYVQYSRRPTKFSKHLVSFFEIHNRILFKIKALRLTHNTHTTPLKRSEPARKHTHPPPHHILGRQTQ